MTSNNNNFKICTDVNELIPPKLVAAGMCYDNTAEFLITRLRYDAGFLYLFLTGIDDVQFYYKSPCTIYSYKRCFHTRSPCFNKCDIYKSMVVTGLKGRECHRIKVYKVDRAKCKPDDSFLLDNFCSNENRVQMQLGLCEGYYVSFKNGVKVNDKGEATGDLGNVVKLEMNQVRNPTAPTVACYDLETYTNLNSFSNAKTDPIITISLVLKTHKYLKQFCFIYTQGRNFTLDDRVDEPVDGEIVVLPYNSERNMLAAFMSLLCRLNPDTILDYNGDKFDLPYLLQRAAILKINPKFIQRYDLPPQEMNTIRVNTKFGYSFDNHFMKYFNHLDVYQFIKNSFDASKLENLRLDTTASYYLKVGKVELSVREMMRLYGEGKFAKIVKYNVRDSLLPINMFIKCKMANKMYADAALLYLTNDDSQLSIFHRINLALFNRAINNKTEAGQPDPYFFNKGDLSKIMSNKRRGVEEKEEESDQDEDEGGEKKMDSEGDLVDFTLLDRSRVPQHQLPPNAIPLCDLTTRIKFTGGKVISPKPGYYGITCTFEFSQLYTSIMIYYTTCLSNLFYGSNNKVWVNSY